MQDILDRCSKYTQQQNLTSAMPLWNTLTRQPYYTAYPLLTSAAVQVTYALPRCHSLKIVKPASNRFPAGRSSTFVVEMAQQCYEYSVFGIVHPTDTLDIPGTPASELSAQRQRLLQPTAYRICARRMRKNMCERQFCENF